MTTPDVRVRFEEAGPRLTAVEIVRRSRSPVIARLHGRLLALGIVVSSYQVKASPHQLTERVVIERQDGSAVSATLTGATKSAVLELTGGSSGA